MNAKLIGIIIGIAMLQGCATVNVKVERLPIEIGDLQPKQGEIPVYEWGVTMPERAGIPIAMIGAIGNEYADADFIKSRIARRAAKLGADYVVVSNRGTREGVTYGTYGGGAFFSGRSTLPTMHAQAVVFAPVRCGFFVDEENRVIDVSPSSPANRAGMRIGDRVLAINGDRITNEQFGMYRTLASASPGDRLTVELVNDANQQRTITIITAPNH